MSDPTFPTPAIAATDPPKQATSRCTLWLVGLFIGAGLLAAVIVDAVVLSAWIKDKNKDRVQVPLTNSSRMPTIAPSIEKTHPPSNIERTAPPTYIDSTIPPTQASRLETFRDLLVSNFVSSESSFLDETSPQYRALDWIANTDQYPITESTATQIIVERYVMAVVYYSTNGDSWTQQFNFLANTPVCSWHDGNDFGVTCGTAGFTQSLGLFNNSLVGTIPSEVKNLTNLKGMYLWGNDLRGTIPTEVGLLGQMTDLYLAINSLTGSIPSEVFLLQQLTDLAISFNQLTGTIPGAIGKLSNLQHLFLNRNIFSGTIPTDLGYLTELKNFTLNENLLNGTVPSEIGSLSNLQELVVWGMSLSGSLPSEMGMLQALAYLDVAANALTGTVPSSMGALENLEFVDFSFNDFTGDVSTYFCNRIIPIHDFVEDCGLNKNCSCCTQCCDSSGDCSAVR